MPDLLAKASKRTLPRILLLACSALGGCRRPAGESLTDDGGRAAWQRTEPPRRVLSQNRYWAREGKADEVYAWRLHATDVQVQMGLPRGQVFRGHGGEEPDVIWQIEMAPEEASDFQRIQRDGLATFQPVMAHMSTLIRRFEASSYGELSHREETKPVEPRVEPP